MSQRTHPNPVKNEPKAIRLRLGEKVLSVAFLETALGLKPGDLIEIRKVESS